MKTMKRMKAAFKVIAAVVFLSASFPVFSQTNRPEWIRKPPKDTAAELYFCGESEECGTQNEARNNAVQDAIKQISGYMYTYISSRSEDFVNESGITGNTVSTELSESETKTFSEMVVSNVKSIAEYSERPRGKYKVWVLCVMSPQEMEAQKERFERELSESYTNQLLLIKNSAKNAVELLTGYETLYRGINPLKQSIVKFNSPDGGMVNFFEYLETEIKNLAGGISFEPAPPQTAQKGEALSVSPRLRSTSVPAIGGLRCRVSLMRGNTVLVSQEYTVTGANTVPVRIETDKLDDGKYTVRLELLLSEVTKNSRRNPDTSFSFEVTPTHAAVVITGDTVSEREREMLRQSIQQGLQNYGTPLFLNTTETTAGKNRYEFIVTLRKTGYPAGGLTSYFVTLSFARDGQVHVKAESKELKDTSVDLLFRRFIAGFISNNRQFFTDVNNRLEHN
jgi:hypothetical protein